MDASQHLHMEILTITTNTLVNILIKRPRGEQVVAGTHSRSVQASLVTLIPSFNQTLSKI